MSATLQQIYNDLSNPAVDLGAAMVGLGAFVREISGVLLKVITILKTPVAQKEIKDVRALAADFQQAAVDAGHPAPTQVNQAVNALLAALPVVAVPPAQPPVPGVPPVVKALLVGFALLALAGQAHAEVALSESGTFTGALLGIQPGGSISTTGGILVGYEINGSWGYFSTAAGTPWINIVSLSVGGGAEELNGKTYGDFICGLGTQLPNGPIGTNLVLGPVIRLGTGEAQPTSIGIGLNAQFGQILWSGK